MKKVNPLTRRAVNLEYKDAPGKSVAVAGSFNQWQPDKMMTDKNGDGVYRCRLLLTPGEYQYKFLVDGEWRSDALNPDFVPNEFGSLNSVITVKEK
ncbi:MAG: glycogen-binding domain-containing protein [Lentisphaeria bacterium]|nr:glycogen-binding domain-containing protein [Lentisphaeria bacterium]